LRRRGRLCRGPRRESCCVDANREQADSADGGGESNTYSASSTFDFAYRGDLLLGLIDSQVTGFPSGTGFESMEFTIVADGVEILDTTFRSLAVAESFFRDKVIDLGSDIGPNIDLTLGYTLVANGSGGFGVDFAVGGVVPETSTWTMMLIGFAGLGYAGYRRTREPCAAWPARLDQHRLEDRAPGGECNAIVWHFWRRQSSRTALKGASSRSRPAPTGVDMM
jgi:hypothetical protein